MTSLLVEKYFGVQVDRTSEGQSVFSRILLVHNENIIIINLIYKIYLSLTFIDYNCYCNID